MLRPDQDRQLRELVALRRRHDQRDAAGEPYRLGVLPACDVEIQAAKAPVAGRDEDDRALRNAGVPRVPAARSRMDRIRVRRPPPSFTHRRYFR